MKIEKDYEKAFEMIQEIEDCYNIEIELLCQRMYALRKFIKIYGRTMPNGKQIFLCHNTIDIMNDIINGNIKESYLN